MCVLVCRCWTRDKPQTIGSWKMGATFHRYSSSVATVLGKLAMTVRQQAARTLHARSPIQAETLHAYKRACTDTQTLAHMHAYTYACTHAARPPASKHACMQARTHAPPTHTNKHTCRNECTCMRALTRIHAGTGMHGNVHTCTDRASQHARAHAPIQAGFVALVHRVGLQLHGLVAESAKTTTATISLVLVAHVLSSSAGSSSTR